MKHISEGLRSERMEAIIAKMPPHLQETCREAYLRGRREMQQANTVADWNRVHPDEQVEPLLLEAVRAPGPASTAGVPGGVWTRSGLERHEQNWSLEFLAKQAGKADAAAKAATVLAGEARGLVTFYGDVGRGKSGMLKSLVAGFLRRGIPARYVSAAQILLRVRSSFHHAELTEEQLISEYAGVRVLAVDEFDVIPETDFAYTELRALLDLRYNRRFTHLTLLATNAQADAMPEHWQFMVSRMQSGERVLVGGGDLRAQRPMRLAGHP